jgi:glutathione S-transferase
VRRGKQIKSAFAIQRDVGILGGNPKTARWRQALRARPSVQSAVASDYAARLRGFLLARNSRISQLMRMAA